MLKTSSRSQGIMVLRWRLCVVVAVVIWSVAAASDRPTAEPLHHWRDTTHGMSNTLLSLPSPSVLHRLSQGVQSDPRRPQGVQSDPRRPQGVQGDPRRPQGVQGDPRRPQGAQGDPRRPHGVQGDPRRPQGAQGDQRRPQGAQGDPRRPHGVQGDPRRPQGVQGDPRRPQGVQGDPRLPQGAEGDPRRPQGAQGDPRRPQGVQGVPEPSGSSQVGRVDPWWYEVDPWVWFDPRYTDNHRWENERSSNTSGQNPKFLKNTSKNKKNRSSLMYMMGYPTTTVPEDSRGPLMPSKRPLDDVTSPPPTDVLGGHLGLMSLFVSALTILFMAVSSLGVDVRSPFDVTDIFSGLGDRLPPSRSKEAQSRIADVVAFINEKISREEGDRNRSKRSSSSSSSSVSEGGRTSSVIPADEEGSFRPLDQRMSRQFDPLSQIAMSAAMVLGAYAGYAIINTNKPSQSVRKMNAKRKHPDKEKDQRVVFEDAHGHSNVSVPVRNEPDFISMNIPSDHPSDHNTYPRPFRNSDTKQFESPYGKGPTGHQTEDLGPVRLHVAPTPHPEGSPQEPQVTRYAADDRHSEPPDSGALNPSRLGTPELNTAVDYFSGLIRDALDTKSLESLPLINLWGTDASQEDRINLNVIPGMKGSSPALIPVHDLKPHLTLISQSDAHLEDPPDLYSLVMEEDVLASDSTNRWQSSTESSGPSLWPGNLETERVGEANPERHEEVRPSSVYFTPETPKPYQPERQSPDFRDAAESSGALVRPVTPGPLQSQVAASQEAHVVVQSPELSFVPETPKPHGLQLQKSEVQGLVETFGTYVRPSIPKPQQYEVVSPGSDSAVQSSYIYVKPTVPYSYGDQLTSTADPGEYTDDPPNHFAPGGGLDSHPPPQGSDGHQTFDGPPVRPPGKTGAYESPFWSKIQEENDQQVSGYDTEEDHTDVRQPGTYINSQKPGIHIEGHQPGTYSDGHQPGIYIDGHQPGIYIDGHQPGIYIDGHQPGIYIDGHQPGIYIDGHQPGTSIDSHQPGTSIDGHQPGTSTDGHQPGTLIDGHQPGAYISNQQPGTSIDGHQPGAYINSHQPGTSIDGHQPGIYIGGHQPGTYINSQQPGTPIDSHQPGIYIKITIPGHVPASSKLHSSSGHEDLTPSYHMDKNYRPEEHSGQGEVHYTPSDPSETLHQGHEPSFLRPSQLSTDSSASGHSWFQKSVPLSVAGHKTSPDLVSGQQNTRKESMSPGHTLTSSSSFEVYHKFNGHQPQYSHQAYGGPQDSIVPKDQSPKNSVPSGGYGDNFDLTSNVMLDDETFKTLLKLARRELESIRGQHSAPLRESFHQTKGGHINGHSVSTEEAVSNAQEDVYFDGYKIRPSLYVNGRRIGKDISTLGEGLGDDHENISFPSKLLDPDILSDLDEFLKALITNLNATSSHKGLVIPKYISNNVTHQIQEFSRDDRKGDEDLEFCLFVEIIPDPDNATESGISSTNNNNYNKTNRMSVNADHSDRRRPEVFHSPNHISGFNHSSTPATGSLSEAQKYSNHRRYVDSVSADGLHTEGHNQHERTASPGGLVKWRTSQRLSTWSSIAVDHVTHPGNTGGTALLPTKESRWDDDDGLRSLLSSSDLPTDDSETAFSPQSVHRSGSTVWTIINHPSKASTSNSAVKNSRKPTRPTSVEGSDPVTNNSKHLKFWEYIRQNRPTFPPDTGTYSKTGSTSETPAVPAALTEKKPRPSTTSISDASPHIPSKNILRGTHPSNRPGGPWAPNQSFGRKTKDPDTRQAETTSVTPLVSRTVVTSAQRRRQPTHPTTRQNKGWRKTPAFGTHLETTKPQPSPAAAVVSQNPDHDLSPKPTYTLDSPKAAVFQSPNGIRSKPFPYSLTPPQASQYVNSPDAESTRLSDPHHFQSSQSSNTPPSHSFRNRDSPPIRAHRPADRLPSQSPVLAQLPGPSRPPIHPASQNSFASLNPYNRTSPEHSLRIPVEPPSSKDPFVLLSSSSAKDSTHSKSFTKTLPKDSLESSRYSEPSMKEFINTSSSQKDSKGTLLSSTPLSSTSATRDSPKVSGSPYVGLMSKFLCRHAVYHEVCAVCMEEVGHRPECLLREP